MFLNKVIMIGNLTRDPEIRQTGHGSLVCCFPLATNRSYTRQNGEREDEACYIDVTVWGKSGEACGKYLKKGRSVYVEGRLVYRTWTNERGERRSCHELCAEHVQFLSSGKGDEHEEASR